MQELRTGGGAWLLIDGSVAGTSEQDRHRSTRRRARGVFLDELVVDSAHDRRRRTAVPATLALATSPTVPRRGRCDVHGLSVSPAASAVASGDSPARATVDELPFPTAGSERSLREAAGAAAWRSSGPLHPECLRPAAAWGCIRTRTRRAIDRCRTAGGFGVARRHRAFLFGRVMRDPLVSRCRSTSGDVFRVPADAGAPALSRSCRPGRCRDTAPRASGSRGASICDVFAAVRSVGADHRCEHRPTQSAERVRTSSAGYLTRC